MKLLLRTKHRFEETWNGNNRNDSGYIIIADNFIADCLSSFSDINFSFTLVSNGLYSAIDQTFFKQQSRG